MDNNLNNTTFAVNIDNLKSCFNIIQNKTQQSQQLINDVYKYLQECRKDSQFPGILLQIFDNPNEDLNLRLLAIVEFKNVIKESWKIRSTPKAATPFPDQLKREIRATLVGYLQNYQEKHFRTILDETVKIISYTDFPKEYPELVEYFMSNTEQLKGNLNNIEALLSVNTRNLVKTMKIVLNDKSRHRIGDHKQLFGQYYLKMMQVFHDIWDYFHTNLQGIVANTNEQNIGQIEKFMALSRKVDKIYVAFLVNGVEEMVESEEIVKATSLLVQRVMSLTEITKNLKGVANLVPIYQQFNKNLHKFLYSLSDLQFTWPLIFKDSLVNYLQLIEFIIENTEYFDSEYVHRAAVISLSTSMRKYSHKVAEIQAKKENVLKYEDVRKACIYTFQQFFTEEKIQSFFNTFVLKLLPRRPLLTAELDVDSLDEFIEIENDQFTSEFEKLETPLYNLTLKCTLDFLLNFTEQSIPLIHNLAAQVTQNQFVNFSPVIRDGIFAMIGQLPVAYDQLKIDASNFLDLGDCIKYLEMNAAKDLNLAKRIPVLIYKWTKLFEYNTKIQIVQNIVQIISVMNHFVVQYECCMCLKILLKTEPRLDLDYGTLSQGLIPIIIELLERFKLPQAQWGLIELLKLMFTKAQYSSQNDNIIAMLQSSTIQILTQSNDNLLLGSLADMFKTIIASFPYGTQLSSLFQICIDFIDFHFKNGNYKKDLTSLWLFIVREYNENQSVGPQLKDLFSRHSDYLLNNGDPDELSRFINIIEEYILAEIIVPDDYINIVRIMETKYELALKVAVPDENVFNLKSAILSLMSTLVLIIIRQNALDSLKILFQKLLTLMLSDLLMDFFDQEFKSLKTYKASLVTLINRFIILNFNDFMEMLNKFNIGLNIFMEHWVKNMRFLSSPHTRRINAIAIAQIVPHINDQDVIAQHLEDLVKVCKLEVMNTIEKGNDFGITKDNKLHGVEARIIDVRDSERKVVLRQTGLYGDVNLKDLFVKTFKPAIEVNNLTLDDLNMIFKDTLLLEFLVQVLSS